jgi:carboxylate-amine ligase
VTIPQRFGEGPPPLTLGVEEELVVLDARTLDQVGHVDTIVGGLRDRDLPGRGKTELHASVFELNTDPSPDAAAILAALTTLRAAAAEVAAAAGLAVAATGAHPFASPEAQPIVQEERYVQMVAHHGLSARRQNVQGLHVHLAMPSGDACWHVLEGMLPWLPVVLALSANSPWLDGELTGMASNRAPVLVELPRAGCPPALASYADWEAWVERFVRLGVIADYTRIWWDVRPHPLLGTLEVRMPDQPTDVHRSAAFAGLLQGLGRALLEADVRPADRSDYEYNRWAAARFGVRAVLVAPGGERTESVRELAGELFDIAGADGNTRALLDPVRNESDLQMRFDDPREATADLVARSLA